MLKVHLEPAQATVTPGTGLILTVVVTNEGDVERTCRVRVVGLDAPWVEHSDGELTVPIGSRLEVPIRVTLPLGYPRGETLVGFEVQADGGEPPVVVDTRLAVSDLESLNIGLSPVTVRGGWRGKFRLNIENRGTDPLTIKLTGRGVGPEETKSDLDFTFKPANLTLRPGERVKTRGSVTGKRHVFGNPRRRALTVTAQGETAPRHVQGAFVQRPLMPRNVLRIVGLVLVLAMWAGGLTAGVKLTSGKGKASAQDASAQIDPDAAGPSGTDGTAAGGANGTGSEEAGVPAAGGAIAGQVKGPTDASGITVKLRPVALADDLSTDLAAETVSFVSSSTEDAPKESAQTLRREPTGPVGPTATTTTDAEGKWAFGGLKTPANYEVTFSKAGFAERTYIISVDDQAPTVALEVPMVPGNGSLSGTVKGPNGPLGGAVVTVTDGTVTFRATTPDSGDDAGKWSIDGLTTPATYMVSASLRGYGTESTSLALDSGGSENGVDLTMIAGVGSISGHITGAGVKLGNITVTATNGDVTRTASTLTEGDAGAFSLPQLPIPGDYTISVTGNGWIPQTMALALKGNASKVDLDLVKTTATIIGTVKNAAGAPLASTGVTLAADKPIVKTLSAIDPAGTYELSGLAPGTYTLSFDRADFKSESTIVTVASGDRKSVDMTLTAQTGDKIPKDAVVRGIVRSSTTGNPISGVQVSTGEVTATSTATATSTTTATTDATGAFVLDKLAPGSYDLKFTSGHYQPLTRTLRIGAKSDTTIDVTMLILGGVQGVVTDLTATRLVGVTVTVVNDPTAIGQPGFTATTTTDATGQYSLLEQLTTGKYIAKFNLPGYSKRERNFEAAAGTVAVGDVQLIELARIHGTIQTPDSSASGGFRALTDVQIVISIVPPGGTASPIQTIDHSGSEYMVTDLEPGDYQVKATKSGFGTSTKQIDDLQLREERDGGLVLAPGAVTATGHLTYDDHGTPANAVGVTVTATAVTGFDTLTIFPFIQPHVSTVTTTTNGAGIWTILGQLTGTSASYTYTGTGYTTVPNINITSTQATDGTLDAQLTPNPRPLTGTLTMNTSSGTSPAVANVQILGGSTNLTVHPNSSGVYSFPSIPVGSYVLNYSATNFVNGSQAFVVTPGDQTVALTIPAQTMSENASIDPYVRAFGAPIGGTGLTGVALTVNGVTQTTDATGHWPGGFRSLSPGTYSVLYHKAGYIDVTTSVTVIAGDNATSTNHATELAVVLRQLPDLTVNATRDLDGTLPALATAGLTAQALDGSSNPVGPGITATNTGGGTYVFADLTPGNYRVTASATGHDDKVVSSITMVADADQTIGMALKAWTPLRIHVLSRFNGATSDLTGEAAHVNAVRTLDANNNAVTGQPTVTFTEGASGVYTAPLAQPGTYTITVNPTTHVAGNVASSVVAGTTTAQSDLTVDQLPRISITTRKKLDGSSSSLTTATVTVTGPGGTATVTHTGGTNLYVADALTPGSYAITVSATDHDTQTFTGVAIAAGQSYTNTVDLLAWAPLSLHLQTHFGTTTGNLTSAVANVHAVRIKDAAGATVTGQPTINFSGGTGGIYTSSSNPPPGTYTITANPSTHVSGSVDAVSVAGDTPTQADLTIEQVPRITITTRSKLDGATSALNTATVTVTGPGGTATVTHTGGTNIYVADGLTPGNHTITVSRTDHDTQTFSNVAIGAGQDYANTVDLLAWTPITLHLQSRFGTTTNLTTAAADVHAVRIKDAAGATVTSQPTISFSGGTGGIYTSTINVVPGTYTITADPTSHVSGNVDKVVVAGTTPTDADLTIQQKPRITITTRSSLDGVNSALNTATVTVVGPGGTATVTHTGGTNVYVADGLSAGSYTITVSATDHDTQTFTGGTAVSIANGDDYANTVDLLAWTPVTLHLQSLFGTTTNLTTAAANVHAVRIKDAAGATVTSQPTISFSGGTGGIYTSTINVVPGTYTITANPATHVSNSVDKVVVAGTTPTDADLTIKQKPRITITTNSRLDGANTAFNTAVVTITGPGGTATVTHTGGTNVYVADALTPGSYSITVSGTDKDTQTFTGGSAVTIVDGDNYTQTVNLLAWTPITVHVQGNFNTTTTNLTSIASSVTAVRTLDANGDPVTGQPTISFSGGTGGIYTSTINVTPGTYSITGAPATHVSNSINKTAVAGTTPTTPDLLLQQKPRITITTNSRLDGVNTAFNTAVVTITGPGGTATVTHTGGTNVYVADALTPGTYDITVSGTDKDTQTFTGGSAVAVVGGDDYTQTVNLLAWTPVTLHLQSLFGTTTNLTTAAADVHAVRIKDAAGATVTGQPTINFSGGTGGIYTSTINVTPGTYTITANPATHVSNSVDKVVVAGTTPTDADLTVKQKPRITITTNSRLDSVNTAFNTAAVTITGPGGTATVTHTGGTNVYVADALTAGTYDITVSGTDKDTQTFTGGTAVVLADGDNYTQTVNLLAWTPITVHVQGHFTTTTNLTSIASSVTAVRTLDANGDPVTGQPTITFTGGTGGIYTSSGNVVPGTYSITGAPATHVSNSINKTAVAGTTPTTPDLLLEQKPRITITTNSRLDSVNTALNTATVTITGPGGTATVTHTGGTNVYVADTLTPGTYDITVSATDKDTQTFTGGTAVAVVGGQDYAQTVNLLAWTPIKVRLRGELNGVFTNLTSNSGDLGAVRTNDANGDPVTGQPTINFSGGSGGVYTSTINVTPGTYRITGDPANYDPNFVDVVAVAGTTPGQGDLVVQKLPALTVTVNSHLDGADTDLTTATVTAQKLSNSCTGSSDNVGANPVLTPGTVATNDYSFANLTAGCYKVIVSAANHVTQTFTNSTGNRVNITAGVAASLTVNLLKHPPLTLSLLGRNGASSPFNTTFALPGATATMTATSGGSTTTLTDQGDGTYTKAVIVPGTYTLTVTAPNYGAMTPQTLIVIAAGVTHADLAGTLTATPGSITGTVRDSVTNGVLAGVSVTANFSGTPGRVATTDASGNYTISSLEPATWSVDYEKNTYSSLNVSVTVTAATASTSNRVLVQLGEEISGTVNGYAADPGIITSSTDNPKVPLAGALVTISRPGYTATRTSAADGTYTFADVPATTGANDYTIAFTHDKYLTRSLAKTTSVASSSSREDNLIAHTGTATVTVKDLEAGASPLLVQNAVIQVAGVLLATPLTDTSDASGLTDFHLPPGTYTASLVTPPSGYRASAATVPITVALSSGVDGTTLLGTGTTSADYSISKAVTLDVNLTGLVNSDTATVTVSWDAGAGTSVKTNQVNGHLMFTDLPPGKAFTVQAAATNYTGGAGSSIAVTLGGTGTANAPLVADKAKVEVLVTGLINGDATTVTLDGNTSTSLTNGQSFTFNSVTPGVSQPLTFSNTNYDGSPASLSALDAGGDYTATDKKTLTLTAKDGRLLINVSGLLGSDEADIEVTWDAGAHTSGVLSTSSGLLTVANIPADKALSVTVTPPSADYTGPGTFAVTALLAKEDRAVPITLHPFGEAHVTLHGLTGGDTYDVSLTCTGCPAHTELAIGDAGTADFSGANKVPAGVVVTIVLTPTGTNTDTYTTGSTLTFTINTAGGSATPSITFVADP